MIRGGTEQSWSTGESLGGPLASPTGAGTVLCCPHQGYRCPASGHLPGQVPCWTQGTWAGGCQGLGQASVLDTQRTGPGPRALSARPLPEARPVGLCLWPQGGPYWLVRVQGARCREVEGREAGVWTPRPPCSDLLSCTLALTGASPFVCSRNCYYSSYIPISCVQTELIVVPKL